MGSASISLDVYGALQAQSRRRCRSVRRGDRAGRYHGNAAPVSDRRFARFRMVMGQNNDTTEHGDLQGQQGGNLSKNRAEHRRLRQPEEGYARPPEQIKDGFKKVKVP